MKRTNPSRPGVAWTTMYGLSTPGASQRSWNSARGVAPRVPRRGGLGAGDRRPARGALVPDSRAARAGPSPTTPTRLRDKGKEQVTLVGAVDRATYANPPFPLSHPCSPSRRSESHARKFWEIGISPESTRPEAGSFVGTQLAYPRTSH